MLSRNTKSVWLSFFVQIPKQQWDKLDPKATKCIFIGYPSSQKGYWCYLHEKKWNRICYNDVTFHVGIHWYSIESKENKGKLVPLIQYIPPPSYQGPTNNGKILPKNSNNNNGKNKESQTLKKERQQTYQINQSKCNPKEEKRLENYSHPTFINWSSEFRTNPSQIWILNELILRILNFLVLYIKV